jgi:hypothetical protein
VAKNSASITILQFNQKINVVLSLKEILLTVLLLVACDVLDYVALEVPKPVLVNIFNRLNSTRLVVISTYLSF